MTAEDTPLPTRRQALAGGALLAVGWAVAAEAATPSDVVQLERLLALEDRLESAYEAALARGAIEPSLGETLLHHERQHVRGLEQALRGRGRRLPLATVRPPQLGAALGDPSGFARYAIDLETEAVRAYQQVLTTLRNDRLLLPLGSIMAGGAQHVVALRRASGEELLALA